MFIITCENIQLHLQRFVRNLILLNANQCITYIESDSHWTVGALTLY